MRLAEQLESNELWTTILNIAGGDGEKALALIEDPDALQAHPDITKLYERMADEVEAEEDGAEE